MKTLTVQSTDLESLGRLDAYFHLSDGRRLARHAESSSLTYLRLGSGNGINAKVWAPARFKRVYAVDHESYVPYLRPSDTLNYLPRAADHLSATRSDNIDSYRLKTGIILVTCSGRNLGPAVYVDDYLARFVLSHDMVRVEIVDETLRFYVLGILGTLSGQQLLRKDKSGSVIDHITVDHVAALDVPMLHDDLVEDIATRMKKAAVMRESARLKLSELEAQFEASMPPVPTPAKKSLGWTISSQDFIGRIDAAPYDPVVQGIRRSLKRLGGQPLREVAQALKPPGRYKTVYVDQANGVPILSGGQLLQIRPLNQKFIAKRALTGIERYRLKSKWIAYQADGRSEEALGEPVMITKNREDWLASGHVGRLVAKDGINAGSVYLAFQTTHAQRQLKALASGSVVDATFPEDAELIVLPPLSQPAGQEAETGWGQFAEAQEIEDTVFAEIERHLAEGWNA